jgi:hypothetical protein
MRVAVSSAGVPQDVIEWVRGVFAKCNSRVTEKIAMAPNVAEPSLDMSWIEHLSRFSSPVSLASGWRVKIESHYLGGLRHWDTWEIADIGVIVFFRSPRAVTTRKVALLQSKRLYPANGPVREEARIDFEIGFGRFDDPEDEAKSLGFDREYQFELSSRYGAIEPNSLQIAAIDDYQTFANLRVYYHLYNPWEVPSRQRIPLSGYVTPSGEPEFGVRVVPATEVHRVVSAGSTSPSLESLRKLRGVPPFGWRLEAFIADEVLGCRQGDVLSGSDDKRLRNLFFRRTGPIAAAISITVESPDQDAGGATRAASSTTRAQEPVIARPDLEFPATSEPEEGT